MKLKQTPTDFRVEELLRDDVVRGKGRHRVYRVTKSKRTSLEAARVLGEMAGVATSDVSMAGLKDRQGVTQQYMSIPKGKPVRYDRRDDLAIEPVGFAEGELTSKDSTGNRFRIIARDLGERELRRLRAGIDPVREHGLPNYFDEQRFGNLRHGQGWIAKQLCLGQTELALKRLLSSVSKHDDARSKSLKSALFRKWGDWRACRDIAGKFGRHHSVFEHLRREPEDFAGAFRRVASRERLIHLYAWQSHLWNRAVALVVTANVAERKRFTLRGVEGKLLFPRYELPSDPEWGGTFPLPGAELEGVRHPAQAKLLVAALDQEGMKPTQLRIDGVPGFALKAEERPLVVVPRDLRVRPAEPDRLNEGRHLVKLTFDLPRGSYATLVVRRLVGPPRSD